MLKFLKGLRARLGLISWFLVTMGSLQPERGALVVVIEVCLYICKTGKDVYSVSLSRSLCVCVSLSLTLSLFICPGPPSFQSVVKTASIINDPINSLHWDFIELSE